MAQWLEKEGFCLKRHREVTLSYLRLVFGSCTAEQLKRACQLLRRMARAHEESQKHYKAWEKTRFAISWLRLKRVSGA